MAASNLVDAILVLDVAPDDERVPIVPLGRHAHQSSSAARRPRGSDLRRPRLSKRPVGWRSTVSPTWVTDASPCSVRPRSRTANRTSPAVCSGARRNRQPPATVTPRLVSLRFGGDGCVRRACVHGDRARPAETARSSCTPSTTYTRCCCPWLAEHGRAGRRRRLGDLRTPRPSTPRHCRSPSTRSHSCRSDRANFAVDLAVRRLDDPLAPAEIHLIPPEYRSVGSVSPAQD